MADENKVIMEDGEILEYDVLCLNVGSRTRGAEDNKSMIKGVKEYSLTTRPINDILRKIEEKETSLKEAGIIPEVIICGAGAAGTELSFGFKKRWSEVFGQEIKVTLLSNADSAMKAGVPSVISEVTRKLKEHKIDVILNA